MDVMHAAFQLVHQYPGGATALAPVLSKTPATLSHEVSPNYPTAKLGLADAVALSKWTGDRSVVNAFAAEMGCLVMLLPALPVGTDLIAEHTANLAREFGHLMTEVANGMADGAINANELVRIEREGSELVAALQCLLQAVQTKYRDVPRSGVRHAQ
jgi:hypothetical protein